MHQRWMSFNCASLFRFLFKLGMVICSNCPYPSILWWVAVYSPASPAFLFRSNSTSGRLLTLIVSEASIDGFSLDLERSRLMLKLIPSWLKTDWRNESYLFLKEYKFVIQFDFAWVCIFFDRQQKSSVFVKAIRGIEIPEIILNNKNSWIK